MGRCAVIVVVLLVWCCGAAVAETPFAAPDSAEREFVNKRTPVSRTWEMPSGQRVTQVASAPAQWRDGQGTWHDYDTSLISGPDGWTSKPGPVTVSLPEQLGASSNTVRVSDRDGNVVTMAFLGSSAKGEVADDVALYRGVAEGVDLRLRAVTDGLKEDALLRDENASRDLRYRIAVNASDLALQEQKDGGLRIVRAEKTLFVIPAPTLVDDDGVPGPEGSFELAASGPGEWTVRTVLPQKWLNAPERSWPVAVDPTVYTFNPGALDECQRLRMYDGATRALTNTYTYCNYISSSNYVGKRSAGSGTYRYDEAMMQFNPALTLVQTDAIQDATLKLYRHSQSTVWNEVVDVKRITVPWSASSPPSANYTDPAPYATLPKSYAARWTDSAGPVSLDVSTLVGEWQKNRNSSAAGFPNYGLQLSQRFDPPANDICDYSEYCLWTGFSHKAAADVTQRPLLEVRSWPKAANGNAVITPGEGDLTGKRIKLQARALASSVTSVRFQYIAGTQRKWAFIPAGALKTPTRGTVSSQDIPVSGPTGDRRSDLVVWDLTSMTGGTVDGPVHVRAWLESPVAGEGGMTDEVNFRLDRRGVDKAPTVPVGPGELSLLSGEFTMSEVDASAEAFLQSLSLTRTYRSRGVSVRNADMFGSGWEANVQADGGELPYKNVYNYSEVKDVVVDRQVLNPELWNWELFFEDFDFETLGADIETVQDIEHWGYEYAVVEAADGTKMTFTQVKDPSGNVTDWTPDDLHPGFTLARASTGTAGVFEITLTDPSGNVAKFLSEAANSPSYRLSTFKQPGNPGALSYSYEASGTRQRLKAVTAPTPTGGHQRSLVFTWGNVGTPSVPRVTSVGLRTTAGGAVTAITNYSYDANARLIQATDARVAGNVRYTRYQYNSRGQLDQVSESGKAAWTLAYNGTLGDSTPRLWSVSRAHPDEGTATRTIRYNVPLTGTTAPYDMSTTETAKWGQVDDLPWDAVAIWPEDTVPSTLNATTYRQADIYYLGLQGLTVNVARPGGAISALTHDGRGNVIRALTPQGRSVALAAGANSAAVAVDRSTLYQYASNDVDVVATREPVSQITLSSGSTVTGRRITTTNYDDGAPSSGGPFHLPTSKWRAVESGGRQLDVRELVRFSYAGEGGMSGWTARHATKTIVDPAGRALTSYSILHGSYPIVEETRSPAAPAGGSTPDVQWHQYFAITPTRVPAAILASSLCGSSSAPGDANGSGRLCLRRDSTAGYTNVQRRLYSYTAYGHVAQLKETRTDSFATNSTSRITTHQYNGADELTSASVTEGGGTATPATSYTYDAATGAETTARSSVGTITRTYDSNGRLSTYTDASGALTSYRYDLRSRRSSMTFAGVTTTYGYDERDNVASVDDAGIGTPITATFDLDDRLAGEALPNGLVTMQSYDETGRPMLLSWTQTIGCTSDCTWARSEIPSRDTDGRTTMRRTNTTAETLTYDSAGRLTQSDAVRLADNRCVRRTYAYDGGGAGDSNRTSSSVWTSAPGSACGTGTPTTRNLTYGAADRVTNTGWVWDEYGRATTVPAPDSGGTGSLTASYYTNDMVRQLTLDGRTHTYGRDPLDRTHTISSSGASKPTLTSTNRYSDDSDEPTYVTRSDGVTTRDIEGPSGLVVASKAASTVTYQLRDLQGSIIATAPASGPLAASTEYDPFGIVTTASPHVIDWSDGVPANGWLGAHQRATQFGQSGAEDAGPIEMGARVYLPKVGRFLQEDPIDGGSLNAYDYAFQDPTNLQDLSGKIGIGAAIGQGIKNIFKKKKQEISNTIVNGVHSVGRRCTKNTFLGATFALGDALRNNWDDVTKLFSKVSNKAGRRAAARTLARVIANIPGSGLIGFTGGCLVG